MCQIASNLIEFCHIVVLDKFEQVLTSLNKFEIVSNRINYNKSGPVCRIVSNRIISIMTCLDMFENRIKSHQKHYGMFGQV